MPTIFAPTVASRTTKESVGSGSTSASTVVSPDTGSTLVPSLRLLHQALRPALLLPPPTLLGRHLLLAPELPLPFIRTLRPIPRLLRARETPRRLRHPWGFQSPRQSPRHWRSHALRCSFSLGSTVGSLGSRSCTTVRSPRYSHRLGIIGLLH